jgi:hypothetical protein
LDISGAFDTVNHTRLLDTLRDKGYPGWVIRWLKAWLQNRSTSLHFDGRSTEPFPIYAGVPQGSPLSPILFVLYISSLYEVLKEKHPHLSLVGFADDTNLLAFGKTPEANIGQLEAAWQTCLMWAKTRGMSFEAEKCELIHFNKGRKQWQEDASLAQTGPGNRTIIRPMPASRFLGVWLDWKLSWKAHSEAVKNKLKTQDFALSRIAAKTWGPGLIRAREVFTKCIRSAIAFGATSYHTPTRAEDKPKGITASLYKAQNRSLRIVAGAYRAMPIRSLETETWVPPLDLYLNKRLADFEARLAAPLPGAHSTNNSPTSTPSTSGSSTSIPKSGCGYIYGSSRVMTGVLLLLHATVMSPVSAAVSTAISLRTGPIFPIPDARVRFPSLRKGFRGLAVKPPSPKSGSPQSPKTYRIITDLDRYRRTDELTRLQN